MVNLRNGLLDINTQNLLPHMPEFLSPIQLPIEYIYRATCDVWDKFTGQVFPQDAAHIAYELLAWLMVPNVSLQKAVLLLGDGSNGKSRYLKALESFLGRRNTAAISLHRLEEDRFSVARLVGKLANICPDLPSEHLTSTSTFKSLVGGDTLQAERKYQDSFEFAPFCRLLFSANNPPRSGDSSSGFFRRWWVIPFDRVFAPDSKDYIPSNKLDASLADPQQLSGALNKALDAMENIKTGILEPASMRHAAEEFREMTDPLAVWLETQTLSGSDYIVTKKLLLEAYNLDARNSDRSFMTATAFGLALRRLRPGIRDAQRTIGDKITWVWTGIGLKANG